MSNLTSSHVALAFTPFVGSADNEIPPLAPALIKSLLEVDNIRSTCFDFNVRYRKWVDEVDTRSALTAWMMQPDSQIDVSLYLDYQAFINQCLSDMLLLNPDSIGISVFSQDSQRFVEDLCYAIRVSAPDMHIVLGGTGTSVLQFEHGASWGEVMLSQNLADAVIAGEAEQLVGDAFKFKQKGMVKQPVQLSNDDLIDVPAPNFDDYNWSDYGNIDDIKLPITGSKGCVRDCTFCDVAIHWPKFRHRTGTNIADEIITMYQKYGIKNFTFTDSLINGGMRPFREMNEALAKKLPRTVNYSGQFICRNSSSMPEKDFVMMKAAGCEMVNIGMESGSESVRDHMRKKFSDADVHYTAEQLVKNKILQLWNIIVGYPTETDDDWQKTIDLIKMYSKHSNLIKVLPVGVFQMLDGTPMTEESMLHDLSIDRNTTSGYNQFNWVSSLNKGNNLKKRVHRWLELVDLLVELDMLAYHPDRLKQKKLVMLRQLEYYESDKDLSSLSFEAR